MAVVPSSWVADSAVPVSWVTGALDPLVEGPTLFLDQVWESEGGKSEWNCSPATEKPKLAEVLAAVLAVTFALLLGCCLSRPNARHMTALSANSILSRRQSR